MTPSPTPEQALSFYRAALLAARVVDQASDPRMLDRDADAAWKAYGEDLPAVVRCDLVLRNFAMLYPAAFAPGPVFGLSGWYDDSPWGSGFSRPERTKVEAIFAQRSAPLDASAALGGALDAWGVAASLSAPADPRIKEKLTRATNLVVCGTLATVAVVRAFAGDERLSLRAQVVLVSDDPAARQLVGMACAMNRESGVPLFANLRRKDEQTWDAWAAEEKRRLGVGQARAFVSSADGASEDARAASAALAASLGATETIEVART
jgi:hypothetical protein